MFVPPGVGECGVASLERCYGVVFAFFEAVVVA